MRDTSPPAFPCPAAGDPGRDQNWSAAQPGMTLRQYFAGQALAGFLANADMVGVPTRMAEACVIYADALVEELAKP